MVPKRPGTRYAPVDQLCADPTALLGRPSVIVEQLPRPVGEFLEEVSPCVGGSGISWFNFPISSMLSAPVAPAARSIRLKPRLKEAREEKGLSQAHLGRLMVEKLGDTFRPNHVGLFELGYRDSTWPEVEALAALLDVDPNWLASRNAAAPASTSTSPPVGAGLARAHEQIAPTPASPAPAGNTQPAPTSSAPNTAAAEPSRLPPTEIPARNGTVEVVYREQLGQLLSKANQTLLDRTLRPAEWRAWRGYAERLKAALRAL